MQGAITTAAVVTCLVLSRPLRLHAPERLRPLPLAPMLREVWSFGLVQLAGLVGSNLAGWWLTFLVARGDPSMVQMGFFGVASQLRNIVGIAPSLLTEGSYAVMADPGGEAARTPHRVMALCTFASLALSLVLAAVGIVIVPWALTLVYGRGYSAAGLTAALALAIAVVHMGNAPAAARLTIVSIRATGVINTAWAVFVALAATAFLLHGGSAWQAMAIYFVAHILSSTLVLLTLHRLDHVPAGMTALFTCSTVAAATLAGLALLRASSGSRARMLTGLMTLVLLASVGGLYFLGKRHGWLPRAEALAALRNRFVPGRVRHV